MNLYDFSEGENLTALPRKRLLKEFLYNSPSNGKKVRMNQAEDVVSMLVGARFYLHVTNLLNDAPEPWTLQIMGQRITKAVYVKPGPPGAKVSTTKVTRLNLLLMLSSAGGRRVDHSAATRGTSDVT